MLYSFSLITDILKYSKHQFKNDSGDSIKIKPNKILEKTEGGI